MKTLVAANPAWHYLLATMKPYVKKWHHEKMIREYKKASANGRLDSMVHVLLKDGRIMHFDYPPRYCKTKWTVHSHPSAEYLEVDSYDIEEVYNWNNRQPIHHEWWSYLERYIK